MNSYPSIALMLFTLLLSACTTFEYHETKQVPIERVSDADEQLIDEQLFLDIGVVLFDPGTVDLDSDQADYSSVRQSEAVWYTNQLKWTLESSNAWGLIRVLPAERLGMDVTVTGTLLESNGEVVKLLINVTDSSGAQWFSKEYQQRASAYAYNPEVDIPGDPFQATFNEIANDLFNHRAKLSSQQLLTIRSTAKILFARDFVPDAFNEFVATDEQGQIRLLRVPASSDPMMLRVDRIRSRNDLFLDVVQDYYRAFNNRMEAPYQEWRKLSYREVLFARQLEEQARREKIAGLAVIAGGIAAATSGDRRATRGAGHIGIFSGARIFANSFLKSEEALMHSSKLRELSTSLESELEPSIVDLQDRSVTLSGTVDDQYQEWRRILAEMFRLEEGEPQQELNSEPPGGAEDSLIQDAEGSLPLKAEGSLSPDAEGSLSPKAEGSLPLKAEGSLMLKAEGSLMLKAEGSLMLKAEGSENGPGNSLDAVTSLPVKPRVDGQ